MTGKRARGDSIRRRVTLATLAVAIVSVAVVFAVFYVAWSRYTLSSRTRELSRQVRVVASGLDVAGVPGSGEDVSPLRERLLRVESGLIGARLVVTDGAGRVAYSTAEDAPRSYPIAQAVSGTPDADGFFTGVRTLESGGRVLVVATRLAEPDRYLLAIQPVGEIDATSLPVLGLLALAALAAVAAAWATGVWLSRRITGPIVRLTSGVRAVAAGDWGHQVPVEGEDEVGELARAFNGMSARVADAYRAQKDFVGDVSHELRTPITSISGFAGALLDGTVKDEEGRRRSLEVIHAEAGRISGLTRALLALADLDAGNVTLSREPVDGHVLAEALSARFAARAGERDVSLSVGPLDGSPLGDFERVLQAASVLLDNALAYTPQGGSVRVSAASQGPSWFLSVEDSGPGIPEADRERVFGRFTRLDSSRSASAGGTGLGLPMCRRLVELMGGAVRVDDSPLGGARFTISLPSAK